MKDFNTTTDRTCTTPAMLCGEALRQFEVLAGQVGSTTNGNLKLTKEGLLRYFLPFITVNKQTHAMRHAMRKAMRYTVQEIFRTTGITE